MHYESISSIVSLPRAKPERRSPMPLRLACHCISSASDLPMEVARRYSRMKYGDTEAVAVLATDMTALLLRDRSLIKAIRNRQKIAIASSAYGSIPTAANAIMQEVRKLLCMEGIETESVKIDREGGFGLTDYDRLSKSGRQKAMRKRRISLAPLACETIRDKYLIVIDDLRSTGAHEAAILKLLLAKTRPAAITFAYCISFTMAAEPVEESLINHVEIQSLEDLLPFYIPPRRPFLNARVLKFILMGGKNADGDLDAFLPLIGKDNCNRIYEAALSRDGYSLDEKFRQGFLKLQAYLEKMAWIPVQ